MIYSAGRLTNPTSGTSLFDVFAPANSTYRVRIAVTSTGSGLTQATCGQFPASGFALFLE